MHEPAHWIGSLLIRFEAERIEAEKANKRHRRGSGKPAANPRSKRG